MGVVQDFFVLYFCCILQCTVEVKKRRMQRMKRKIDRFTNKKAMKTKEMDFPQEQPEDRPIYAPVEEIRNIERVIDNLETVHRELLKVAEGMKAVVL